VDNNENEESIPPPVNIHDYGHFEGTKFVLNKPIKTPDGEATTIDFTAVLPDLHGETGLLEEMIAMVLRPDFVAASTPLSDEEAAELAPRIHRYN
jgi:hypothetical protein